MFLALSTGTRPDRAYRTLANQGFFLSGLYVANSVPAIRFGSAYFDFVRENGHVRFRHHRMLCKLLRVIGAGETAQHDTAFVNVELKRADSPAQSALHANLKLGKSIGRI